jgi:hypothetical protein
VAALDRIGSPVGRALTPLRPIGAAIDPLLLLPRLVLQAAADIQSIAASTRTLTVAIAQLEAISERVDSLDGEVKRMRAAVESIGGEVAGVRESVEPLGGMAARLSRFGPRRRGPGPVPPAS